MPIVFTTNCKQRPVTDIVKELCNFIDKVALPTEFEPFVKSPRTLVGKKIKQKFRDEDSGGLLWYCGMIMDYSDNEKTHCIKYDGDDELYHYDKKVLSQLKPSNVCESILGLNDYLMTAIPNLNEMALSTLVQVKK